MKLNRTANVIAGCNHHLSVRSVRSFILARVGEKTPDISYPFYPCAGLFLLKEKCPLLREKSLGGSPLKGYEVSHRAFPCGKAVEEKLAEGVGFEPTRLSPAGFQDRCTRPLCEPSVGEVTRITRSVKIGAIYREGFTYSGSSRSFSITIATPS
jgi:hypothetical protein